MDNKRFMEMIIASNILVSYYTAKNSFCILNKKEPEESEKKEILERVISMFENLSTSYIKDIEDIAESAR